MTILRCPVCQLELLREEKRYACAGGHGFDIARQGYVNLLLSSHRPSRAPGDSAAMLADRRAFLDAGHYAPLRAHMLERLDALRGDRARQRVLDLGCGEGYYSAAFAGDGREVYALDIAKPALASAARRSREVVWCVGNSKALPFADAGLDAVLNIFCNPHPEETRRVLAGDGVLLLAGPGPEHLAELREVLYESVRRQDSAAPGALLEQGFTLAHSATLDYRMRLDRAALGQLARMTPHYWRATRERRERLEQFDGLDLRAQFVVREFRR